jgi:hypothetical protein
MTSNIPNNVVMFAGGEANLGIYKAFKDYFNQYKSMNGKTGLSFSTTTQNDKGEIVPISFDEKEAAMNSALKREILRQAGIANVDAFPLETSHPTLKWATFAVVSALIDVILPETIIDSVGMYADISTIDFGSTAAFDIKPRDLFVVSKAGHGKRTTEVHKQFQGQVVINPEFHELTVGVSLYRVLAGKESLADFTMRVVRSLETAFTVDVYAAFAAAMAALSTSGDATLQVAGFTQAAFTTLAQKVQAYNGGAQPVAIATKRALANILPANGNYRYDVESSLVKVGYIKEFLGVSIIELPQVAAWSSPFTLALSDSYIWIVSPSVNKIVRGVLEGSTLSNVSDVYANANLMQTATMTKSWGVGVATNAIGAVMSV